jgi:hypothetical protein
MSVYVDDARHRFARMVMCHMIADSTAELLAMADRIGLDRRWIQKAGTYQKHFDVSLTRRALAVKSGAVEISQRALGGMLLARRRSVEDFKRRRGMGGAAIQNGGRP